MSVLLTHDFRPSCSKIDKKLLNGNYSQLELQQKSREIEDRESYGEKPRSLLKSAIQVQQISLCRRISYATKWKQKKKRKIWEIKEEKYEASAAANGRQQW